MTYWRMQLHPGDDSSHAVQHAVEALAAGFIGLDYHRDLGDLSRINRDTLPQGERDWVDFADRMQANDKVLVIVHHHPFALVTVAGEYQHFSRTPRPKLPFRSFRAIRDVKYYADWEKTPARWQKIVMTDTISPLRDPSSQSYRLIDAWP